MTKRIIVWLLCLVLLFAAVPMMAFAANTQEDVVTSSGTCGDNAYWELYSNGLLRIYGTGAMTDYVFYSSDVYCSSPFSNRANGIVQVVIEDGITSIGDYAFWYCEKLTTVTIPDSVASIGDDAFWYCSSLTSVTIPTGMTSIGNYAFCYCDSLTTVTISASVTNIGFSAFGGCDNLTGIYVDEQNPNYSSDSSGVLFDKDKTTLIRAPGTIDGNYSVPAGVTCIGNQAFARCDSLTGVTIPTSVTSIENYAFSGCTGLTTVTISDSVTIIGDYAFYRCTSLTDIYYSGTEEQWAAISIGVSNDCLISATIHYNATEPVEITSGWSGSTTWVLTDDGVLTFSGNGDAVCNMKNYGFGGNQPWISYADQITSVVVENGVTAVGTGAFMNLTKLETVTLPDSGLKTLGQAAFYGCSSLREIYIPDGVYTIWAYTFKGCTSLTNLRLPTTLCKLDQGAFENCTALVDVVLPGNVDIISYWAFKGCTGLTSVDMQWTNATEIRAGAFKNCTALTDVILPADIQTLGDSAFYAIGASTFTVPETVTTIEGWCFARSSLNEIIFEGNAPTFGDGVFNKIALTAYYPGGNATWTSDIMQNYGGTVTWTAQ